MDIFHSLVSLPLAILLPTHPTPPHINNLLDSTENYADTTTEKTILGSHTLCIQQKHDGLNGQNKQDYEAKFQKLSVRNSLNFLLPWIINKQKQQPSGSHAL